MYKECTYTTFVYKDLWVNLSEALVTLNGCEITGYGERLIFIKNEFENLSANLRIILYENVFG
jgi:hypothetical protein